MNTPNNSKALPPTTGSAFRAIVADPPWDMGKTGKRKSRPNQETKLDYPTMNTESICNLKAGDLAAPDAVLFLWTTHSHLEAAFGVMRSWGFRYQRCLTWDKANGICLFGFHHRTEFCLFGYRGKLEAFPRRKAFPTVFGGASERHSAKPETFFRLVEDYTPGPYLEMFARQKRHGWASWGNEIANDVEMPNASVDVTNITTIKP